MNHRAHRAFGRRIAARTSYWYWVNAACGCRQVTYCASGQSSISEADHFTASADWGLTLFVNLFFRQWRHDFGTARRLTGCRHDIETCVGFHGRRGGSRPTCLDGCTSSPGIRSRQLNFHHHATITMNAIGSEFSGPVRRTPRINASLNYRLRRARPPTSDRLGCDHEQSSWLKVVTGSKRRRQR